MKNTPTFLGLVKISFFRNKPRRRLRSIKRRHLKIITRVLKRLRKYGHGANTHLWRHVGTSALSVAGPCNLFTQPDCHRFFVVARSIFCVRRDREALRFRETRVQVLDILYSRKIQTQCDFPMGANQFSFTRLTCYAIRVEV